MSSTVQPFFNKTRSLDCGVIRKPSLSLLWGLNCSKKSKGNVFRSWISQSNVNGTPTVGASPTVMACSMISTSAKHTFLLDDFDGVGVVADEMNDDVDADNDENDILTA